MSEVLIKVENVSKKFCRSLKKSLWYGMQDLGREITGRPHGGNGELRPDEFWAVNDVSFEVRRGECLGLIGRNGAGKTTLLRMLNGLIKPDKGKIEMRGRVGALIALGAGFNPILTGRENIYVNALILGLSKNETTHVLNEIIEFSGIEKSIDMPVKNYSSGMHARLGFAIAAHTNPEILLIDEILAVGDIHFRSKCFDKISSLKSKGTSAIFVSHELSLIDKMSDNVLLLKQPKRFFLGHASKAIENYRSEMLNEKDHSQQFDNESITIEKVLISPNNGTDVLPGKPFSVCISYNCIKRISIFPSVSFHIGYGEQIAACRSDRDSFGLLDLEPGEGVIVLKMNNNPFSPGFYTLSVRFYNKDGITPLVEHYTTYPFVIKGGCNVVGYVNFDYKWERRSYYE
jgi:lipopolysaccharide transport system ATP-binding protein